MIAEDGQFDGSFVSRIEIGGNPTIADLPRALAVLDAACQPSTIDKITMRLTEMALVMKARAEDGTDTTARIAAIANLLREWPGDVALAALKRHRDGGKFFPSWSEILTSCRIIGSKRIAFRTAVRLKLAEFDHAP